MSVRSDVVNDLVERGLLGMEASDTDFTATEFYSACFSLVLRAIKTGLQKEPDCLPIMQKAVQVLQMECVDVRKKSN